MNTTRNVYSIVLVIVMVLWAINSDNAIRDVDVSDVVLLLLSVFIFSGVIMIFWIQKEHFPDSFKNSECSKIKKELEGKIKSLEDKIKSLEDKTN